MPPPNIQKKTPPKNEFIITIPGHLQAPLDTSRGLGPVYTEIRANLSFNDAQFKRTGSESVDVPETSRKLFKATKTSRYDSGHHHIPPNLSELGPYSAEALFQDHFK